MSTRVASDFEAQRRSHRGGTKKAANVAAKLFVTGACLWYVSRQIDWRQVSSAISLQDFRWAALAVCITMLQIPLAGLRWSNIADSLGDRGQQITRAAMIAATSVGLFFSQVLPSVAGDGVRAWLFVQLGGDWRTAVTSVVIDRAVGLALLVALGFVILLLPSSLMSVGRYRDVVLVVYGALIFAGTLGVLLGAKLVSPLARRRYFRWLATLATDTHLVLFGSKGPTIFGIGCLIHALTIIIVWSVGRAQSLSLSLSDAAVLFTVMVSVLLVPISIGGWGLRELAVVSLLTAHGVAPERAFLFSVCFGLVLAVGSLPGAIAWLFYRFAPVRCSADRGT
jgi:uncharacterized membrane protein YbhN (UPF0104 family)